MSKEFRSSIDTLYFGLKLTKEDFSIFVSKIKNFLFFFDDKRMNFYKSKNRFYCGSYEEKKYGFFMYFIPRKGCKNDFVTIELTGHFFRMVRISIDFIDWLLSEYYNFLNWQRCDVALDICYDDLDNLCYEDISNRVAFPFPSYSDKWHYARLEFETYGRVISNTDNDFYYINMVAVGRSTNRLRVYDKSLDLEEKYNLKYSEYYGFLKDFKKVYRIELQVRGDGLKGIMSKAELVSIFPNNYENVVTILFSFLFNKFKFKNLDYDVEDLGLNMNTYRKNPNLYKQLESYKKYMFSFYNKYIEKYDEIKEYEKRENELMLYLRKKIDDKLLKDKKLVIDEPFTKGFNLEFLDFDKEYQRQQDRFMKQGEFRFYLRDGKNNG